MQSSTGSLIIGSVKQNGMQAAFSEGTKSPLDITACAQPCGKLVNAAKETP